MRKIFILSVLSFLFASLTLSCTKRPVVTEVKKISAMETEGLLRNDFAILLDVRELEAQKTGTAARAVSMPWSRIEGDTPEWHAFLQSIPKSKQIVVYGEHSAEAGKRLAGQGYTVSDLGSFDEWKKAGLPVR